MKQFCLILFFSILGGHLTSQVYSKVMEGYSGAEFSVIEDKGVVVYHLADKASGQEKEIIFEFLDLQLNSVWTVKSLLDKSITEVSKYSSDNFLHIIYSRNDGKYDLFSLNIEKKTCSIAPFELSKKEFIQDMVALDEKVFFRTNGELYSINSESQRLSKVTLSSDSQKIKLNDLLVVKNDGFVVTGGSIRKGKMTGYYVFIIDMNGKLVAKPKISTETQRYIDQVSCAILNDGTWLIYGECRVNLNPGLFIRKFNGEKLIFNKFLPYLELSNQISSIQNSKVQSAFGFKWHEILSTSDGLIIPAEVVEQVGAGNDLSYRNTHIFSVCLNTDGETEWISSKEFPEPNFYSQTISSRKFTTIIIGEEDVLSFVRHVDLNLVEKYSLHYDGEFFQEKLLTNLTEVNSCEEIKRAISSFVYLSNNIFLIKTQNKGKFNNDIKEYCIQAIKF